MQQAGFCQTLFYDTLGSSEIGGRKMSLFEREIKVTSTNMVANSLRYLGLRVKDKVTGFEGVVTGISFDLYGCVQCDVCMPFDKDKTDVNKAWGRWFDIARLDVLDENPVMRVPKFLTETPVPPNKGPEFHSSRN
jgi:hypothetical protein